MSDNALNPEAEKMIEVLTNWLNKHHEANGDDALVNRANYDEVPHDEPRILLDWNQDGDRIIRLYANAYHDEGGPAYLTGFFDYDDGMRWDNETRSMEPIVEPNWTLDAMVFEFDTLHTMIWSDGQYNPDHLPGGSQ